MSRESDINDLCDQVLNMSLKFWDNPNGGYEYTCPLCFETAVNIDDLEKFPHSLTCGYFIAKDLKTGFDNS